MAASRLEKIGTIYTRTRGLLQSGALNWEDRPLWYDIHEAFPPKEEPRFDRPPSNLKIKPIFYQEDKIRALFHKNNKQIGTVNLSKNSGISLTQRFIETYKTLDQQYDGKGNPEELYSQAIELLKKERDVKDDEISLSTAFKKAQSLQVTPEEAPKITIKVSDLFKS